MSTHYQDASSATDIIQLKRSGFVCAITLQVSTVCCTLSLTMYRFPVFRLLTLSFSTTFPALHVRGSCLLSLPNLSLNVPPSPVLCMCPNSSELEIGYNGSAVFVVGFGVGVGDHVQVRFQVHVKEEEPVGERIRSRKNIYCILLMG